MSSVALTSGVGFSRGSGTLTYEGREYPIDEKGPSGGGVDMSVTK